jgi:hypothetical protein
MSLRGTCMIDDGDATCDVLFAKGPFGITKVYGVSIATEQKIVELRLRDDTLDFPARVIGALDDDCGDRTVGTFTGDATSTWHFRLWYRDVQIPPALLDLTDGLSGRFCQ